jgi:hypothetical protein
MNFEQYMKACSTFADRIHAARADMSLPGLEAQRDLAQELVLFLLSAENLEDNPIDPLQWATEIADQLDRMSKFADWLERWIAVKQEDLLVAEMVATSGAIQPIH